MSFKLSEGALSTILSGGHVEDPVMQILGHKKIAGTTSSTGLDRYRLLVSDGKHLNSFAMLATQLNSRVTSGELCDFTVVQVSRYITSMVTNADRGEKRVMVILDLKVLALVTNCKDQLHLKLLDQRKSVERESIRHYTEISWPGEASPVTTANVSVLSSPGGSIVHTHPIASLSPYQNKWVIKVRVISKSAVRTWSNARGEGKLFSMDLMDETGEIRATAFKDQCDKFYDMIEVNKIYLISRCC
ncbi:hypothetical protein L9F63_011666 [Diploptera punctata]|uniref:Replication protein A 70 kDa DNA-binding subunit n=1 Tax=Diploptera punctata TaxID=6984 RepID=A0AAD8AF56_DIPPU|nr:hypothetical protein L9F63_011666 [Diploptera punctata]